MIELLPAGERKDRRGDAPPLIIVALVPLALRGVRYRPSSAAALLRRNVALYGLGGIVVPFAGIKLIDLLLTALGA